LYRQRVLANFDVVSRRPVTQAIWLGKTSRDSQMKFMVLVKATAQSEAGSMPSTELLTQMGNFNEELVMAGVMLAG
jgi:hypothetical protein